MCSTAWKRKDLLTCPMLFTYSVWDMFLSPEYTMTCSISQRCGTIIPCERRETCHPISFGILGCYKHLCVSLICQRYAWLKLNKNMLCKVIVLLNNDWCFFIFKCQILQAEAFQNPQCVDSEVGVIVPEIPCPLSPEDLAILQNQVNPTAESTCFGYDIYLQAHELALNLMS